MIIKSKSKSLQNVHALHVFLVLVLIGFNQGSTVGSGPNQQATSPKMVSVEIFFTRFRTLRIHEIYAMIPSLKLTDVALEDVCLEDDCFILGWLPGRCHVSFRECRDIQYWMISSFGVFSLGLLTSWNRKGDGSPLKSHK